MRAAERIVNRRVDLISAPTPLEPMDRLAAALGMDPGTLWVKRDDLTGLGGGGNKARKLEYLCADAVGRNCDVLVTGAGTQSNHCRMTAAAANKLGLDCVLVLDGDRPEEPTGNVLLFEILGATVVWAGPCTTQDLESNMEDQCDKLSRAGRRPALVPIGGSVPLGCLGYVRAARELRAQDDTFDLVVVATGSCGTHAGLAAGFGDFDRILGVRVGGRPELESRVTAMARETAELAGLTQPTGTCTIEHGVLGEGYAKVTDSGLEAIRMAARCEGIVCDPIYTGKALAGLIAARRSDTITASTRTLFWHTGGMPGLFAEAFRSTFAVP